MTTKQHTTAQTNNRQLLQQKLAEEKARKAKRRLVTRILTGVGVIVVAALVAFGLWSARATDNTASGQAPAFSLKTTAGTTVSLSDFRGKPVILYFNEGAGCGSCTQQMAEIEKNPGFAEAGITVLPIVMNTAAQINHERERLGVVTPFALDNGTVSKEYKALGTGMHANLPGHGFVLIDAKGVQRWSGNYPSMWLDPKDLLAIVDSKL